MATTAPPVPAARLPAGGGVPRPGLRGSVASLFAAYVVSFAVVGLSYLLYSRLLTPAQFGLYSAALVIATFGQFLLDGGLKNTIIKSREELTADEQGTLLTLMLGASLILAGGLVLLGGPIRSLEPAAAGDYRFLAAFAATYLVAYPLLAFPTARLERAFRYRRLAWIETCGGVIERAGPAVLLVLGTGMSAFVVALVAGSAVRVVALTLASPLAPRLPTAARIRSALPHLAEGGWFQAGAGTGIPRDGLHVLLVGPLFGAAWIGYYGWAQQLSRVASQAFVQVSARVSLPLFAQADGMESRWRGCVTQVRLLAMVTGPLLGACLVVVPSVNQALFHGRWTPAVALLPLLFLRMVPSMATTPVAALLLVERGARRYALSLGAWTAIEIAGAAALLVALGPVGLAVSCATMVWPGLFVLIWGVVGPPGRRWAELLRALLLRPSLAVAVAAAAGLTILLGPWFAASNPGHLAALAAAGALVAVAYSSEADLRAMLRRRGRRPGSSRVASQSAR